MVAVFPYDPETRPPGMVAQSIVLQVRPLVRRGDAEIERRSCKVFRPLWRPFPEQPFPGPYDMNQPHRAQSRNGVRRTALSADNESPTR